MNFYQNNTGVEGGGAVCRVGVGAGGLHRRVGEGMVDDKSKCFDCKGVILRLDSHLTFLKKISIRSVTSNR